MNNHLSSITYSSLKIFATQRCVNACLGFAFKHPVLLLLIICLVDFQDFHKYVEFLIYSIKFLIYLVLGITWMGSQINDCEAIRYTGYQGDFDSFAIMVNAQKNLTYKELYHLLIFEDLVVKRRKLGASSSILASSSAFATHSAKGQLGKGKQFYANNFFKIGFGIEVVVEMEVVHISKIVKIICSNIHCHKGSFQTLLARFATKVITLLVYAQNVEIFPRL